jgi:hypothetical protein
MDKMQITTMKYIRWNGLSWSMHVEPACRDASTIVGDGALFTELTPGRLHRTHYLVP